MEMPGFSKTLSNREQTREEVREEVYAWYLANSGGVQPKQQCENPKPQDSELHWWLEPLLPDIENPMVIEQEKLDGQWTIRIDPVFKKIQVFT